MANGYRESPEAWADLLRDAARRGMRAPVLAVGDRGAGDVVVVDVRRNTVAFVGDLDLNEPAIDAVLGEMRDLRYLTLRTWTCLGPDFRGDAL